MKLLLAGCLVFVGLIVVSLFATRDNNWMTAITIAVAAVVLPIAITKLFNRERSLLGLRPARDPEMEVLHDPVLGELHLDEDGEWWIAQPHPSTGDVELMIAEPQLLDQLRDIFRNFDDLRAKVAAFLAAEAEAQPDLREEISQLELATVALTSPARGMLDFDGPDENLFWRCDYIDGNLANLGFDD